MWTTELTVEQVVERLRQHSFPYFFQHLYYDYGGRLFVLFDIIDFGPAAGIVFTAGGLFCYRNHSIKV